MNYARPIPVAAVVALLSAFPLCAQQPNIPVSPGFRHPAAHSRQMVLVITGGWEDFQGTLRTYERATTADPWIEAFEEHAMTVGSAGLAWGSGLHGIVPGDGPVKREGDNRSPAGVFSLDLLFGYAPAAEGARFRMPYLPLDSADECIDDPSSMYYNMVVNRNNVSRVDWKSAEHMRRGGIYYAWGVVVGHNTDPRMPDGGSCIFLHVWGGSDVPTSGCTSLEEADLLDIMEWLSPDARPVLVQLPRAEYDRLRERWQLP